MKNLFSTLILCIFFLSACTQTRVAQKAYAFVEHTNAGTIAVDRNGRQLSPGGQTTVTIYLEGRQNATPLINDVIYNGATYKNLQALLAAKKSIVVGNRSKNNNPIILTPAKGNWIWKIDLSVADNNNENDNNNKDGTILPVQMEQNRLHNIIIKGKKDGKAFSITVNNIQLLEGPDRM